MTSSVTNHQQPNSPDDLNIKGSLALGTMIGGAAVLPFSGLLLVKQLSMFTFPPTAPTVGMAAGAAAATLVGVFTVLAARRCIDLKGPLKGRQIDFVFMGAMIGGMAPLPVGYYVCDKANEYLEGGNRAENRMQLPVDREQVAMDREVRKLEQAGFIVSFDPV